MADDLPTEFDLIVVGTGLTESILAAAASRIGKNVLHIDSNDYYGGSWASFNLENIESLVNNVVPKVETNADVMSGIVPLSDATNCVIRNAVCEWMPPHQRECGNKTDDEKIDDQEAEENEDLENVWTKVKVLREFRKFNIDLTPKLLFARGDLVELLISSNISRYAEFRGVDRITTLMDNEIKAVPCSRSDVFTSKNINVVEKRLLMKVLSTCMAAVNDGSEEFKDFENKTFRSYLEHKRLTPSLIHYILYSISMSDDRTLCLDGVANAKTFLQSLGRYGNTPFLFPMHGCGEMPQAFCRLCAVYGGIYCLKRQVEQIQFNETLDEFCAIKCGEQIIRAKSLVLGNGAGSLPSVIFKENPASLQQTQSVSKSVEDNQKCGGLSRAVFITSKPLGDEAINGGGGGVQFLKLPPTTNGSASSEAHSDCCSGAFVIQLAHFSGTCPKDLYLIHVTCRSSRESPKLDMEPYERLIFSETYRGSILWSMYFNIPTCLKCKHANAELPLNFHLACGPYLELDYDRSIREAKKLFSQIYPSEEFLPRAPDSEEIVIEGDNSTDVLEPIISDENSETLNTVEHEDSDGVEHFISPTELPQNTTAETVADIN